MPGRRPGEAPEAATGADWSLHSGRASTSAGAELLRNEVIVPGNSPVWAGDLAIAHAVMRDVIDLPAVHAALRAAGLRPEDGPLPPAEQDRLVALPAKAEPSSNGLIRGRRHIMWDDSDIDAKQTSGGLRSAKILSRLSTQRVKPREAWHDPRKPA